MSRLEVSEERVDGARLVAAAGEVDLGTAQRLRERLEIEELGGPPRLLVDLTQVTFMDSTGVQVLLRASKALHQRSGRLELICDGGPVRRLLDMLRLDDFFLVHASRDLALAGSEAAA